MRGQAFEVFRLLIAAVVAGAILMVLLSMIQNLVTPTTDPQTAAAQLVKKFATYGGTGSTDYIQFRKGMAIDAKAIARQAYLDEDCIDIESNVKGFECENKVCEYTANMGTRARIKVQCGEDTVSGCNGIGCMITIER